MSMDIRKGDREAGREVEQQRYLLEAAEQFLALEDELGVQTQAVIDAQDLGLTSATKVNTRKVAGREGMDISIDAEAVMSASEAMDRGLITEAAEDEPWLLAVRNILVKVRTQDGRPISVDYADGYVQLVPEDREGPDFTNPGNTNIPRGEYLATEILNRVNRELQGSIDDKEKTGGNHY